MTRFASKSSWYRSSRMIYFVYIPMFFIAVYIPLFTRESMMREIMQSGKTFTIAVQLPAAEASTPYGWTSSVGRWELRGSQDDVFVPCAHVLIQGAVSSNRGQAQSQFSYRIPLSIQTIIPKNKKAYLGYPTMCDFTHRLQAIRKRFLRVLDTTLYPREAGLVKGVVFGDGEGLSVSDRALFREVGLSHTLVASGFNVTIIAGAVRAVIKRFLSRKITIIFTILILFLHLMFLGIEPSILRATIMVVLSMGAALVGRHSSSVWTLCLAAGCMLLVEPYILFSISFQLSVLATLALVTQPEVNGAKGHGVSQVVLEEFFMSVRVFLWTAPVLSTINTQVSLSSILANPLLVWMIPPLFFVGLALACVGMISGLGATLLAVPTAFLASTFLLGAESIAQIPFPAISFENVSAIGLILAYGLLLLCDRIVFGGLSFSLLGSKTARIP